MGGGEGSDGLEFVVEDAEPVGLGETEQVLPSLALEPYLGVGQDCLLCLPALDFQEEPHLFLLGHGLALQQLLVDRIQAEQPLL